MRVPLSWFNLNLITSRGPSLPNTIALGLRLSACECAGDTNIHSITRAEQG